MMETARLFFVVVVLLSLSWVICKPLEVFEIETNAAINKATHETHRQRRFVNPLLTLGDFGNTGFAKIRTKRSMEEECEKLQLCKMHARSGRNFFAAFELYFVNKENARLWDHRSHTIEDCERQFECYYK